MDLATARAIRYARSLSPDDIRAVHFDIDSQAARKLERSGAGSASRRSRSISSSAPTAGSRGRHRVGGRGGRRRGDGVHGAPAPPGVHVGLAAHPPRPHRRQDRHRGQPGPPRGRHHRAVQPDSKLARRGATTRVVNEAMQQESGDRTDTDPGADPDTTRQRARPACATRKNAPGVSATGWRPRRHRPTRPWRGAPRDGADQRGALPRARARGGPVKSVRVQPKRVPRISSASCPTGPAPCSWSSRAAHGSRA